MQLAPGVLVRPVVSVAGLDARRQYRVAHVEETPFYSLAWLTLDGATVVVENAHAALEVVQTRSLNPAAVAFN